MKLTGRMQRFLVALLVSAVTPSFDKNVFDFKHVFIKRWRHNQSINRCDGRGEGEGAAGMSINPRLRVSTTSGDRSITWTTRDT
jgi:hypothetical protein